VAELCNQFTVDEVPLLVRAYYCIRTPSL